MVKIYPAGFVAEKKAAGEFGPLTFDSDEKPLHVFEGVKAGSKQPTTFLFSEKEHSHFILKLEYKWLENRFRPLINHDRDAGVSVSCLR